MNKIKKKKEWESFLCENGLHFEHFEKYILSFGAYCVYEFNQLWQSLLCFI